MILATSMPVFYFAYICAVIITDSVEIVGDSEYFSFMQTLCFLLLLHTMNFMVPSLFSLVGFSYSSELLFFYLEIMFGS